MATTAAILDVVVQADTGRAQAALSRVSAQMASMGKLGKTAGGAAVGVAAIGAAAVVAGKQLYDIGAEFDKATDIIKAGTGATGKELEKLKGDFKAVVSSVPADFDTAASAVSQLHSRLQITGKPLQKLSEQFLEVSRITGTDLDTNIQNVSRAFKDSGVATRDQSAAFDRLFRVSQATGTNLGDLTNLMVKFGSPLRQLGFNFNQSAAMFAKFEAEGVNVQTAMPGLRMALKTFAQAGKDPAKALQATFTQIKKAPTDMKAAQIAFEVFGTRAGPDMAAAIREGRFNYDELIAKMKNGKSTILDTAKSTNDFGENFKLLGNKIKVGLEPLASPIFDKINFAMAKFVSWDIGKALRSDTVRDFVAAIQVLRPLFVTIVGTMKRQLAGIGQMFRGLAQVFRGVTQVIAGILQGNFGKAWAGVKNIFRGGINVVIGILRTMTAPIRAVASTLGRVFAGPLNTIKSAFNKVKSVGVAAFNGIKGAVEDLLSPIRDLLNKLGDIKSGIESLPGKALSAVGLATGTRSFAGGVAMVNERGPEMARYPNGGFGMLGNGRAGAQLTAMPAGTQVFTAAQTRRLKAAGVPAFAGGTSGADAMMRMLDFGKRAASKHTPYVYGGKSIPPGYDCSGFVSAILNAGGLLSGYRDTVGLKSWGQAGSTGGVVVGVRGGAGKTGHTMMRVGHTYFESGGTAGGASIVGGWDGSFPVKRTAGPQYSLAGAQALAAKVIRPMTPKQVFGNKYSKNELVTLATYVHMKNPEVMAAIAMAESKGNPTALGDTGIASGPSKGLWQILRTTAADYNLPWDNLMDPLLNAKGAKKIQDDRGFTPWSTYNSGAYRKFLGGKLSQKKLKRLKGTGTAAGKGARASKAFALPKALQDQIDNYSTTADIAADYAQRAESVGGQINGRDQVSFLTEQLKALLELRNALIRAHIYITRRLEALNKKIARMRPGKGRKAAVALLGQMAEKDAGIRESLEEIHGKGSPMEILNSPPTPGYLGGRILDVQMALAGGTGSSGSSDLDSLKLQQAQDTIKRMAVENRQAPIIRQLPQMIADTAGGIPFAGAFASGGLVQALVGERGPELATLPVGTRISTAQETRAAMGGEPNVQVAIHGHVLPFQDHIGEVVEVYVDGKLRKDAAMRRLSLNG